MAESNPNPSVERFRQMMNYMQFETLPLFSKPHFSWNLKTDYVGRRFNYRPETESTLDEARRMIERPRGPGFGGGPATGLVFLAETQTGGRGRAGRTWISPPDVNLYLTVIMLTAESHHFAYITPLAIARAIEEVTASAGTPVKAGLKWPNDVLIGARKVAGVLIETTETPTGEPVALIGAGINVNLDVSEYPEIADIATSIKESTGARVHREEVLAAFCNHFEALHEAVMAGSTEPFDAWRERLVTLGRPVVATGAETVITGVAVDVNEDGSLVVEQADGSRVRVDAGDVTLSAAAS
jgi:BirA family biotin operon repressor/biotin-[acetyl-CoA-carboxylase] ligase